MRPIKLVNDLPDPHNTLSLAQARLDEHGPRPERPVKIRYTGERPDKTNQQSRAFAKAKPVVEEPETPPE